MCVHKPPKMLLKLVFRANIRLSLVTWIFHKKIISRHLCKLKTSKVLRTFLLKQNFLT